MREIVFRGIDIETREWVYGFYACLNGKEHRIYTGYTETDCGDYYPDCYKVVPKTVGQYTGMTDKNGEEIFEGDIVKLDLVDYVATGVIKWCNTNFRFKFYEFDDDNEDGSGFDNECVFEVVGNVYDNLNY